MSLLKDKKIVQAFLDGNVLGVAEPKKKPEYIKTRISHIFLFPKTVYKLYRKDNEEFNKRFIDLGNEKLRRKFYQEDFFWNHYFNKEVSQRLVEVSISKNGVVELKSQRSRSYDFVIQMQRIDMSQNLTSLLLHHALKQDDLRIIGYGMAKAIAEFPHKPKTSRRNYFDILQVLLDDAEGFAWMADPLIPKQSTDRTMKVLRGYAAKNKDAFSRLTQKDLAVTIDSHSDNVFYHDNKVTFIDAYLPMEDWRIVEPCYSVCRLSADVRVLGGEDNANALIQGYRDFYGDHSLSKDKELFYQIYAALIKATYLYLIYRESTTRKDEADQYWQFIADNVMRVAY